MGATDFTSIAVGKTARAAFGEAQDAARYDYGHAGPRLDVLKVMHWVSEWEYVGEVEYEKEELGRLKSYVLTAKPGTKRAAQARVRECEKRIKEGEKRRAKLEREIGPNLPVIKRMAHAWADKWGPAVGLEIKSPTQKKKFLADRYGRQAKRGEKVFVFFGLASC